MQANAFRQSNPKEIYYMTYMPGNELKIEKTRLKRDLVVNTNECF